MTYAASAGSPATPRRKLAQRQAHRVNLLLGEEARFVARGSGAFAELPERLERLCAFASADENATPFVHPILRAILLHFMIGYDHPFVDGNSRTARALLFTAPADLQARIIRIAG